MDYDVIVNNLLTLYPYWQHNIIKPFAQHNKSIASALSPDDHFLLQIIQRFDGLTMTDIAMHISTTKQQATRMVNRLFERGLLNRLSDKQDRRIIKVVLTDAGRAQLDLYYEATKSFIYRLHEQLSDQELETFNQSMESMLEILSNLD